MSDLKEIDKLIDFAALQRMHAPHRYCVVCGKELHALRPTKKLCGNTCTIRLYRARNKVRAALAQKAEEAQAFIDQLTTNQTTGDAA